MIWLRGKERRKGNDIFPPDQPSKPLRRVWNDGRQTSPSSAASGTCLHIKNLQKLLQKVKLGKWRRSEVIRVDASCWIISKWFAQHFQNNETNKSWWKLDLWKYFPFSYFEVLVKAWKLKEFSTNSISAMDSERCKRRPILKISCMLVSWLHSTKICASEGLK